MDPNQPIIVGLAGRAGTGKTVTADSLAPIGQVVALKCRCGHDPNTEHLNDLDTTGCIMCDCRYVSYDGQMVWTHLFYALPIYRIATARQKIHGNNARNRILYEIHGAIVDLFGNTPLYSAIKNYDDLIDLVRYTASIPCEPEGEKARTFMQEFGSLCREYDPDVFVKWVERKAHEEFREFQREYNEDKYPGLKCGIVVSDVRFENEAEMIANHPNGALYGLTATPEVLRARLEYRDGRQLTPEQANHPSENSIELIPEEYFKQKVDTSLFSVLEQVQCIKDLVAAEYRLSV